MSLGGIKERRNSRNNSPPTLKELLLSLETARGNLCGLGCHRTYPREDSHRIHDAGDFSVTRSNTASGPPAENAQRNASAVPGSGGGEGGVCFPATVALVKTLFFSKSFPSTYLFFPLNLLIK